MKTRFDSTESWIINSGAEVALEDMTTNHLMNLYAMFVRRPDRTMAILVADIESGDFDGRVWTPNNVNDLTASVNNATKMTADELVAYALHSPLGEAVKQELIDRGVDVDNAMSVLMQSITR